MKYKQNGSSYQKAENKNWYHAETVIFFDLQKNVNLTLSVYKAEA